jgi:DNA-binding SARP family transcriptional activator/predicted ATPase
MTLEIRLLGEFSLQADEAPIDLPSRPAQSLLAYLAINAGLAHRREKLAGLLWPDASERNARAYLRQALWRIRRSLGDAPLDWHQYFMISDISIEFDEQSDYWLDVDRLLNPRFDQTLQDLLDSLHLYRGELLPGFYDEWVTSERERVQAAYHQGVSRLLDRLIDAGRWQEVLDWGERWIQVSHSPEAAFRAMMRAYAALGDLAMVSATYQRCRKALDRELGLEASAETRAVYEQIIQGRVDNTAPASLVSLTSEGVQPGFLGAEAPGVAEKPLFVARGLELEQLFGHLENAVSGDGRVVFVTGEAGAGKTALLQEFTSKAMEALPDLVAATGMCNAHIGQGDPYLPMREIMGQLTGDVEARWAAGAITQDHARRLWECFPIVADALAIRGPDLIDVFVPSIPLLGRAMAHGGEEREWAARLKETVERKAKLAPVPASQQIGLFQQYTRVLTELSQQHPLVLVLDDLQWADAGSIGLLFHLGRHLAGNPILVLGAYRQEELALGRDGERHPLESVINEFGRTFGPTTVDLGKADRRGFINALLDSEANRLGAPFREMLSRQTLGHPLFTTELLRGMQERGDLVRGPDGGWIEGESLDWETLPARVESVIAERVGRLSQWELAALQLASVEGEVFTAEVLAQVLGIEEREMLQLLGQGLVRKHRLIRAESIEHLGGKLVSRYRFRHILFQKYVYGSLDDVERIHLHAEIGVVLEKLRPAEGGIPGAALQLARHFQAAGDLEKAVGHLYKAGEHAVRLTAYPEAIADLSRGLELLQQLPPTTMRDQLELDLQLTLGMAWRLRGASPEGRAAFERARELARQLNRPVQLTLVLGELCVFHYVQAEYAQALDLAKDALHVAMETGDPMLEAEGHWCLGFLRFCLGDYEAARAHLGKVIASYDPERHHRSQVFLRGVDMGLSAMAYDACCLWCLGYPDQALTGSERTLGLARVFGHPFTLADVICYAGCMLQAMRGDAARLKGESEALIRLAEEKGLHGWLGMSIGFLGEALAMLGRAQEGMQKAREGVPLTETTGIRLYKPVTLRSLAIAQAFAGDLDSAMCSLEEALRLAERTEEGLWMAELHRMRGELLERDGDAGGAEAAYLRAIEVARTQRAKSWELRASVSLARLWERQGKGRAAHGLLGPICDWFQEGFDTPEMEEAKAILEATS